MKLQPLKARVLLRHVIGNGEAVAATGQAITAMIENLQTGEVDQLGRSQGGSTRQDRLESKRCSLMRLMAWRELTSCMLQELERIELRIPICSFYWKIML